MVAKSKTLKQVAEETKAREEEIEEAESPESGEEAEEEKEAKSVVDERFRLRYKEQGHPTHCGDWLAVTLINLTTNKQGINTELFEEICQINGVDTSKYSHSSPGWQGRLRMTGRNLLAKVIHKTGVLKLPEHLGEDMPVPAEWTKVQRFDNGKIAEAPVPIIVPKVPVEMTKAATETVRNAQRADAKREMRKAAASEAKRSRRA